MCFLVWGCIHGAVSGSWVSGDKLISLGFPIVCIPCLCLCTHNSFSLIPLSLLSPYLWVHPPLLWLHTSLLLYCLARLCFIFYLLGCCCKFRPEWIHILWWHIQSEFPLMYLMLVWWISQYHFLGIFLWRYFSWFTTSMVGSVISFFSYTQSYFFLSLWRWDLLCSFLGFPSVVLVMAVLWRVWHCEIFMNDLLPCNNYENLIDTLWVFIFNHSYGHPCPIFLFFDGSEIFVGLNTCSKSVP